MVISSVSFFQRMLISEIAPFPLVSKPSITTGLLAGSMASNRVSFMRTSR